MLNVDTKEIPYFASSHIELWCIQHIPLMVFCCCLFLNSHHSPPTLQCTSIDGKTSLKQFPYETNTTINDSKTNGY